MKITCPHCDAVFYTQAAYEEHVITCSRDLRNALNIVADFSETKH